MRTSTAELFLGVTPPSEVASLQQLLDARRGEPMGLTMALDLGAAVAERVGALHASGRVLGAFDASRVRCNRDGRVALTREPSPPLAPELKRGEAGTVASDVYAVGHLVYQLLTGRTPAQAVAAEEVSRLREVPAPSRFNSRVDAELDAVVLAALRHEPSERPASVLALQAALDGVAEELELVPEPEEIGRLVAKVLDAQPMPAADALPVPVPSPGAAVATSRLQTAVPRTSRPVFPTVSPEPPDAETSGARAARLLAEVESLLQAHPLAAMPAPAEPALTPVRQTPVAAPASPEPAVKPAQPTPIAARPSAEPVPSSMLQLAAPPTAGEVSRLPEPIKNVVPASVQEASVSSESFFGELPAAPVQAAPVALAPAPAAPVQVAPIALAPAPAVERPRAPTPLPEPSVVVADELADPDALLEAPVAEVSRRWLASPGAHRLIVEGYDELPAAQASLWDSPWVLLGAVGGALLLLLVGVLAWPSPELPRAMVVEPPPARATVAPLPTPARAGPLAAPAAQPAHAVPPAHHAKKRAHRRH